MVRAPEGSKPAMAAAATVNVTADVVAVNHKDKLVTLRGPKGNLVDLRVDDPAQLANIKTGDKVDAVYSEALAVKVDAAPK
jgi:Cu/Ag efflux protein CusF